MTPVVPRPSALFLLGFVLLASGCGGDSRTESTQAVPSSSAPSAAAPATAPAPAARPFKLPLLLEPGHKGVILGELAPDSRRLLSAGWGDRSMKLWDLPTGKLLWQATGFHRLPIAVAFSPSGRLVVVGNEATPLANALRVWDTETGAELPPFPGQLFCCTTLAFGADDKLMLSGHHDHMRLWDVATRKELRSFRPKEIPQRFIMGVALAPDGRGGLITDGKTMSLWDLQTGAVIREIDLGLGERPIAEAQVFWLPGGKQALYANTLGQVRIYDMDKGAEVRSFQAQNSEVHLSLSADGRRALTSGIEEKKEHNHRTLRLWDVTTGTELQRQIHPLGEQANTRRVGLSPDGTVAVTLARMGGTTRDPIRLVEVGK